MNVVLPGGVTVGTLLWVLGLLVAAFFLGAVNPAKIIARVLGKDLSQGSGNPGATNAGRVMGRRGGVLVGVLDVLKGVVPVWVASALWGAEAAYLVGVAVVLGHVYSPYLRGRGGKGVATTLGAILAVHPVYALVLVALFLLTVALSRWVALGSLVAAAGMVVGGVLAAAGALPGAHGWATAVWAWALALVVVVRHRPNMLAWLRLRRR